MTESLLVTLVFISGHAGLEDWSLSYSPSYSRCPLCLLDTHLAWVWPLSIEEDNSSDAPCAKAIKYNSVNQLH